MKKAVLMVVLSLVLLVEFPFLVRGVYAETLVEAESGVGEKIPVFVGFVGKPRIEIIRQYSGEPRVVFRIVNVISANLTRSAIEAISRHPMVAYVEEIPECRALQEETPWGVERIEAPEAWAVSRGEGVRVSVLDTGIDIDWNGTELFIKGGVNFQGTTKDGSTDPRDWTDKNGHGTHVAGTLAALDDDDLYVGVAPEIDLYAVRVLGAAGTGTYEDLIQGIEWALDNSMQIASMSLGGEVDSVTLKDACDTAYSAGVLLVAASGNDGDGDPTNTDKMSYPAAYDSVVAVGGTDEADDVWYDSSTGPHVELSAPAVEIPSLWRWPFVATASGTSMATPHVSGTAALVWAAYPTYTNEEVRRCLQETATDLGPEGRDFGYGYGLVNASYAVLVKVTEVTVSCSPTTVNKYGDETTTISGALIDVSDGTGLVGETVALAYAYASVEYGAPSPETTWTAIAFVETDTDGSYSYDWDPSESLENGYYWIRASFAGDAEKEYLPCFATTGVDLMPNLFIIPELGPVLVLTTAFLAALIITLLRSKRRAL